MVGIHGTPNGFFPLKPGQVISLIALPYYVSDPCVGGRALSQADEAPRRRAEISRVGS